MHKVKSELENENISSCLTAQWCRRQVEGARLRVGTITFLECLSARVSVCPSAISQSYCLHTQQTPVLRNCPPPVTVRPSPASRLFRSPFPRCSLFLLRLTLLHFFLCLSLSHFVLSSLSTLMIHQGILSFNDTLWCGGLKSYMSFPYAF